jgi:hypothetical protein
MKKRDRRSTPTSTILAAGDEAVHREGMELKADTPSISTDGTISAKSVLVGEGSSKDSRESMDTARIIPKQDSRDNFELNRNMKIKKKNNYRVPVQYPDGKPGMPTSNKKANRLLKEGKAKIVKNKLNIFAIKLKFWPIYRNTQ